MPKKRRIRSARSKKEAPYYKTKCEKCQRLLFMKEGEKPKCPICDGNGHDKKWSKKNRLRPTSRKEQGIEPEENKKVLPIVI